MKLLRWFVLFLFLLGCIGLVPSKAADDEDPDEDVELEYDDPFIERNPFYVEPSTMRNSSNSSDEIEEETDDDDSESLSTKAMLGKALAKSRKTPQRALKLIKKHHAKILVAMFVYAFRHEIGRFLFFVFATPQVDRKTGKITSRAIRVRPTAIIKVVFFAELIRRSRQGFNPSRLATILLAGNANPVIGLLMSRLLTQLNTAYIPPIEQHYTFEKINDRYRKDGMALEKVKATTQTFFSGERPIPSPSVANTPLREMEHNAQRYNETVIILDLSGLDTRLSQLNVIRDEISFLLSQHRVQASQKQIGAISNNTNDTAKEAMLEVVVLLESPGGSAEVYGLAAQQLLRLRNEPGIRVTVCVDKVAASGGYMMACTASPGRLYVAPFAFVGSIGVIGQSVNIHKVLEGWGVTPLVFRGGKDKAPLGLIGEVTDESIAKVQDMVDTIHAAFKLHVATARPILAERINEIATGDIWLGSNAVEIGLADRVVTSDEYIGERLRDGARVIKLIRHERASFLFGQPGSRGTLSSSSPVSLLNIVVILQKIVSMLYSSLTNFKNRMPDMAW